MSSAAGGAGGAGFGSRRAPGWPRRGRSGSGDLRIEQVGLSAMARRGDGRPALGASSPSRSTSRPRRARASFSRPSGRRARLLRPAPPRPRRPAAGRRRRARARTLVGRGASGRAAAPGRCAAGRPRRRPGTGSPARGSRRPGAGSGSAAGPATRISRTAAPPPRGLVSLTGSVRRASVSPTISRQRASSASAPWPNARVQRLQESWPAPGRRPAAGGAAAACAWPARMRGGLVGRGQGTAHGPSCHHSRARMTRRRARRIRARPARLVRRPSPRPALARAAGGAARPTPTGSGSPRSCCSRPRCRTPRPTSWRSPRAGRRVSALAAARGRRGHGRLGGPRLLRPRPQPAGLRPAVAERHGGRLPGHRGRPARAAGRRRLHRRGRGGDRLRRAGQRRRRQCRAGDGAAVRGRDAAARRQAGAQAPGRRPGRRRSARRLGAGADGPGRDRLPPAAPLCDALPARAGVPGVRRRRAARPIRDARPRPPGRVGTASPTSLCAMARSPRPPPAPGLLGGMLGLPDQRLAASTAAKRWARQARAPLAIEWADRGRIEHVFTHFDARACAC